jgi:hypothetical protein
MWVGGQRSEIRVYDTLAPQLKPNGWAGEGWYQGELPLAASHAKPSITLGAHSAVNTGPFQNRGRFVSGTVTVDTANKGVVLDSLLYASTPTSAVAPLVGDPAWRSALFTAGSPNVFTDVRVNNNGGGATRNYWFQAKDSSGVYSTVAGPVTF